MARAQFKIESNQDSVFASDWIRNQFKGFDFPYEDSRQTIDAENEFKEIYFRDHEKINNWCEKHLKKTDWKKLKGAIRSKRLRKKRVFGQADMITRVDISSKAHIILKSLAKHHGVTQSEVIIQYMEKAWFKIPEDED